jgi:hypothetical protein
MDIDATSDGELDRTVANPSVEVIGAQPPIGAKIGEWFVERSKFIPLRLTIGERKKLRLLEAALTVSEYTDKIDIIGFGLSKAKRIVFQIRELCAIMSGLVVSANYKQGQELFADRDFEANADFYQTIFELGRRHKIMNPDKMRTTYGKLIYLLQASLISILSVEGLRLTCLTGQSSTRRQGAAQFLLRTAHRNRSLHFRKAQRHRSPPR